MQKSFIVQTSNEKRYKKMINRKLLEKRIKECHLKKREVASLLDITPVSLCNKISNRFGFTLAEVVKLCRVLQISDELKNQIFFGSEFALNTKKQEGANDNA